jgi:tetratricopeptide (TPR) repeat protein
MRRLFLSLLLLTLPFFSQAVNERRHLIYESFVTGNMNTWAQTVRSMENTTEKHALSWKLELAQYYYGLIPYYLGTQNKKMAESTIEKQEKLLHEILKENPKQATAMALMGSTTAFQIALNRLKILVLGKESLQWLKKALDADPNDTQALSDMGWAMLRAPAVFGGDPDAGIRLFYKGIQQYEKQQDTKENWMYLQLLLITARAQIAKGETEKAALLCQKALSVEPRFRRAKDTLNGLKSH